VLGRRALDAPVINMDGTRWPSWDGDPGPVWGVHAPTVSCYRIVPGKSGEEGCEGQSGVGTHGRKSRRIISLCARFAALHATVRLILVSN